ncbi:NAD-dependent malic enzyme [Methylomonas koyamae]|uniref:NAD-dependent malic enzyme n=1 Tax=Methylomonas koyamae TaxID=702114 RepID=UPI001C32D602|nr:NAD-dependent malic enzyme [Methylomonas koyamae]BBL57945.1 NAD-dependent malic enzyme [Methylomonas koyamae]
MTRLSDYFEYRQDQDGNPYLAVSIRGMTLLKLPASNKGTAFTEQERIDLGLDGLLPPQVTTLEQQIERLYFSYRQQADDISKYQFLRAIQDRSEVLFYAILERHLEEMVPIVYTPTIGLAVQKFSSLYRTARGLTLAPNNIDRADAILKNYPWHDIRMIVVTDASAILGIGDQGMGGLSICIGKLALYTVGGGVCPFQTLPINLDVGTNRDELLDDPHYLGVRAKRLGRDAYFAMVDKFVAAAHRTWPKAIIQWEDFTKDVAFDVLARYREKVPCFNDDIQGTGAMALAGILSACRRLGQTLAEQIIVIAGAGAAGIGVASVIKAGMVDAGLREPEIRQRLFVVDIYGLVVDTEELEHYKHGIAQPAAISQAWGIPEHRPPSLFEVVSQAKPSVLIGLTGAAGLFDENLIRTMAANCASPIVMPLSNPTANCEATPADIIAWSDGRAIVATGSPFADVEHRGVRHKIGQGNNAFIFPGLGLAAMLGECRRISDAMVLESAYALADYSAEFEPAADAIYPAIADLQKISSYVAERVLAKAIADGSVSRNDLDAAHLADFIAANQWHPRYLPFRYVG